MRVLPTAAARRSAAAERGSLTPGRSHPRVDPPRDSLMRAQPLPRLDFTPGNARFDRRPSIIRWQMRRIGFQNRAVRVADPLQPFY